MLGFKPLQVLGVTNPRSKLFTCFLHALLLLRLGVVLISVEYNYLDRVYPSVFLSIYSGKSCK